MSVDYYQYLQSPEWSRLRELKLEQADGRCQLCNSNKALHVHHRTYERLGRERLVDLTVLCADCHAKFHDKVLTGTILWCDPQGKHESARASSLWATAVDTSRKRSAFNALVETSDLPDDVKLTWMPGNTIEVQTGRSVDVGKLSRIVKDHLGVWPWVVKAGEQFHPSWANGHDDIIADHAARLQEAP